MLRWFHAWPTASLAMSVKDAKEALGPGPAVSFAILLRVSDAQFGLKPGQKIAPRTRAEAIPRPCRNAALVTSDAAQASARVRQVASKTPIAPSRESPSDYPEDE